MGKFVILSISFNCCSLFVVVEDLLTGCRPILRRFNRAQTNIAKKTEAMRKLPGYFPLYWDTKTGKLWLEIDRWNTEFLHVVSLPAGIGSNDIGLDRGQLGNERIVRFERVGPKVLLIE